MIDFILDYSLRDFQRPFPFGTDHYYIGGNADYGAGFLRDDQSAGIDRSLQLHSGTHQGRFRSEKRHRLTLHIGTHQSAVGVVML